MLRWSPARVSWVGGGGGGGGTPPAPSDPCGEGDGERGYTPGTPAAGDPPRCPPAPLPVSAWQQDAPPFRSPPGFSGPPPGARHHWHRFRSRQQLQGTGEGMVRGCGGLDTPPPPPGSHPAPNRPSQNPRPGTYCISTHTPMSSTEATTETTTKAVIVCFFWLAATTASRSACSHRVPTYPEWHLHRWGGHTHTGRASASAPGPGQPLGARQNQGRPHFFGGFPRERRRTCLDLNCPRFLFGFFFLFLFFPALTRTPACPPGPGTGRCRGSRTGCESRDSR